MAEPLSSLIRPFLGPVLPSFERMAPPPPDDLVAAEIDTKTSAGDVVIDLHGRGGWIARTAVDRMRRVYAYESSALTKLLADLVLRPPDLRHFDATVTALSAQGHGQIALHQAINEAYQSRCPGCGRLVTVDEFIWDGDAPAPFRKSYRCAACRDQIGGGEQRSAPTDDDDIALATEIAPHGRSFDALRARFPTSAALPPDLADRVLDLYTPRNQFALEALIHGIERDLRAPPIEAALRLAIVHTVLAASKLNSYPGRVAALKIRDGKVRLARDRQWREHNPWHLFEEGCRLVRAFCQRVTVNPDRAVQARFGDDLQGLVEGSANAVVRRASPRTRSDAPTLPPERPGQRGDGRNRVRLVLTQPPMRWTTENLAFNYLATSIALGAEAASTLPLEGLAGTPPQHQWGWDAAALRRSMAAVRPVLADDARAILLLDRGGPGALVSGVLGGVGAGYHLVSALLAEVGDQMTGTLEFVPPGGLPFDDPRRRRTGADGSPFQLAAVERSVSEVAVAVLQARGEPARFERLLGEVLVGLDRLGHLRRLVGTRTYAETEARTERSAAAAGLFSEAPVTAVAGSRSTWQQGHAAASVATHPPVADSHPADGQATPTTVSPATDTAMPAGTRPPGDHVGLLLDLVLGELSRPEHPRLVELEPGRWWLRDPSDVAAAKVPLSDRLEWSIFSLLSTAGSLTDAAFYDRIARMFTGHDTPDRELIEAILASYRDPLAEGALSTAESLPARSVEHVRLIGLLTEYGHRLGLRCWIGRREQRRRYQGGILADLLTDQEQRVYLPLIAPGDPEALESVDCIWYLRGKLTLLWEVESSAMLAEPILRRGRRIPTDENLVRFLVIPPERAGLVRLKLSRSPVLRQVVREDNWHIVKSDHLVHVAEGDGADLERLEPILGLDPEIEHQGQQLALFG